MATFGRPLFWSGLPVNVMRHSLVLEFFISPLQLLAILFVADLLHPVHGFAVKLFLNGDVGHGGGWGSTMPMFFTGWKPHDVAWANFFDCSSPALHPAAACHYDQSLAQRVSVPGGSGAGFERDDRAGYPRGFGPFKR